MMKKSIILAINVAVLWLTIGPATAETPREWVKNYQNYEAEYRGLFAGKCRPARRTARIFMDQVDCIWRNDQILLKTYGLEELFYDAAYSRYSSMFDKAKLATASDDYEYFVYEEAKLTEHTEELQKAILVNFLKRRFNLE